MSSSYYVYIEYRIIDICPISLKYHNYIWIFADGKRGTSQSQGY